jgi:hypothetical protein
MKVVFNEWNSGEGVELQLIPETVIEVGQLIRYANSANSERPSVFLSFEKEIKCDIILRKHKKSIQSFYISPWKRIK